MKDSNKRQTYFRAKKHVDCIRDFYVHLIIYLIVNVSISSFLIYHEIGDGETFNEAISNFSVYGVWLFWGIGLSTHAFRAFGLPFIFGRNWEEDKMKEFMYEDINNRWE